MKSSVSAKQSTKERPAQALEPRIKPKPKPPIKTKKTKKEQGVHGHVIVSGNATNLRPLAINTELSLMCVLRTVPGETKLAPYFIVRELDLKILKKLTSGSSGPNNGMLGEQSRRAHIRSSILKLDLDHDTASKTEIASIKKKDPSILGVSPLQEL